MNRAVLAGRYRLDRVLGRGGMGTVYAAHDEVLGRDVAVKVLDLTAADATSMARFTREARILASLQHPHIVAVHDFGTDASTAWLVMPQLPGPDLQTLVNQHGPLPLETATRYGAQAATALAAAHTAGIVHRDVKPANLMLDGEGSVILLDLGIARLVDAGTTGGHGPVTGTGLILGSVPYLAPEVISGAAPGPPADVYALGGVLFVLLTGRTPFPADGSAGLAQHLHAPPPSPAALRPDTPIDLQRLLLRMLDKDPSARPAAADVAAILSGAAGAEARTAVLTPAAGGPATAVLPAPGAPPTRQLPAPAPAGAARTPPRRPRWLWAAVAAAVALLVLAAVVLTRLDGQDSGAATGSSPTAATSTAAPPSTSAPAPPPPADETPDGDPVQTALADLQAAIDAAASGGLAEKDARDAYDRLEKIRRALQEKPADVAKQIEDFEQRLARLQDRGELPDDSAARLLESLASLRNAVEQAS